MPDNTFLVTCLTAFVRDPAGMKQIMTRVLEWMEGYYVTQNRNGPTYK